MATARDNVLGRCRCPVCASERASLRLSEKQLTYVVCNACNLQAFARSDRSADKLRALLLDDKPEPVATAPVPPPPAIVATPTPAAVRRAMAWGVLGSNA